MVHTPILLLKSRSWHVYQYAPKNSRYGTGIHCFYCSFFSFSCFLFLHQLAKVTVSTICCWWWFTQWHFTQVTFKCYRHSFAVFVARPTIEAGFSMGQFRKMKFCQNHLVFLKGWSKGVTFSFITDKVVCQVFLESCMI